MAIYRTIHTNFWEDSKILDEMSIEERYFLLYLLTNPHTNQVGCFEISKRQMKNETDFEISKINELLDKFEKKLNLIKYSQETKELFIENWDKYHWSNSPKVLTCVKNEFAEIKDKNLKEKVYEKLKKVYGIDTVSIQYSNSNDRVGIKEKQKQKENKNKNKNNKKNKNNNNNVGDESPLMVQSTTYEHIIKHLNDLSGAKFKSTAKDTIKLIDSLLKDYTIDDIILVIDKMCYLWNKEPKKGEKDMRIYIRPSTLFRKSNFENYLGMNVPKKEITTKDIASQMDFSEFR